MQAKYYKNLNSRNVRLQVIHSMEAPEKGTTAEAVARYFQNPPRPASAHYCVDNDSEVQCVMLEDIAYAAPGANSDGIQYELAGYAKQTRPEWEDKFSLAMLARTAVLVSKNCEFYENAKTWLSDQEIASGKSGICDHAAISRIYKKSSHWDPGPNFPKDLFVDLVRASPLLKQNTTPTGRTTIMNDCVAAIECPVDGGFQKLQADGGVFNQDCEHYHGSYLEPSMEPHRRGQPNIPFVDIIRVGNSTRYAILRKDGAIYGPGFE